MGRGNALQPCVDTLGQCCAEMQWSRESLLQWLRHVDAVRCGKASHLQRVALLDELPHAIQPLVRRAGRVCRRCARAEARAAGVGAPQAAQRDQAPRVQHHLFWYVLMSSHKVRRASWVLPWHVAIPV